MNKGKWNSYFNHLNNKKLNKIKKQKWNNKIMKNIWNNSIDVNIFKTKYNTYKKFIENKNIKNDNHFNKSFQYTKKFFRTIYINNFNKSELNNKRNMNKKYYELNKNKLKKDDNFNVFGIYKNKNIKNKIFILFIKEFSMNININIKTKYLLEDAYKNLNKNLYNKSIFFYKEILKFSINKNIKEFIFSRISFNYFQLKNYENSLKYILKINILNININKKLFYNKAIIYRKLNDFKKSNHFFKECKNYILINKIYNKNNIDINFLTIIYIQLIKNYLKLEDTGNCKKYYKKVLLFKNHIKNNEEIKIILIKITKKLENKNIINNNLSYKLINNFENNTKKNKNILIKNFNGLVKGDLYNNNFLNKIKNKITKNNNIN